MILLIDNYDSFTYNLVQRLGEIDPNIELEVHRNDQITVEEVKAKCPTHVIISPGPCTPREAGISCAVVKEMAPRAVILGVCLGHQSIAHAFGGQVVRAERIMHGKTQPIHHNGRDLFQGLDNPFVATRYHSLIVPADSLGEEFEITAWCDAPDGGREVMGLKHRRLPLFGVQFHPESFLTDCGSQILKRFMALEPPAHKATSP